MEVMTKFRLPAAAIALLAAASASAAGPPTAAASIKPVHSLLAGVMRGAGYPVLLVPASATPHRFQLKPSDARALANADLVAWIGPELEGFLVRPLAALAGDAVLLELLRADGVLLRPRRRGAVWEDHHDHGAEARDRGRAGDHDHDHAREHREDGHGHARERGEDDGWDAHIWLDPRNAEAMADAMAGALAKLDPERAALYRANAADLGTRLRALDQELRRDLAGIKDKGFIVFHDAWQYFEARYGLNGLGSVAVDPEHPVGAQTLAAVGRRLAESDARCIFREPQFAPALVHRLAADTGAKVGVLDPLGATVDDGPALYFRTMRAIAAGLRDCLG